MVALGADNPADGPDIREIAEAVGLIAAPAAGLAALGLYFGWKRTQTYATYFGVDNSVLGFSVQEYTLRSAASIYRIILIGVGIGLASLFLHRLAAHTRSPRLKRTAAIVVVNAGVFLLLIWAESPVSRLLGAPPPMSQAVVAFALAVAATTSAWLCSRNNRVTGSAVAGGLAVVMLLGVLDAAAVPARDYVIEKPYIAVHTTLAFGFTMLIYALFVLGDDSDGHAVRPPTWMRTLSIVFTALLVAAGLFAATDEYAESVGAREAYLTAVLLDGRRGVIVYSKEDLGFPANVECLKVGDEKSAYQHRCEGLRLFARTANEVLVLPSEWSRIDGIDEADRIISIPEDDGIRLEFTPGRDDLLFGSR